MKKALIVIIRIIAIAVLLVSLGYLIYYISGDLRDRRISNDIDRLKEQGADVQTTEKLPEILDDYKSLYAENSDVIGWLRIAGTNIDNVFMYAPHEHEKYLHTDFYGN